MKTLNEIIEERAQKLLDDYNETRNKPDVMDYGDRTIDYYKEKGLSYVLERLPPRYIDADVLNLDLREKLNKAVKNKKGVYLYGQAGTGKTYILYAMLKYMRAYGLMCTLWNLPEKLARLKSFYSKDGSGEDGITDEIQINNYLFIDDFGAEKVTEWNSEIMYRLINYRYENMLQTYFASNLSLQELAERSGDRIASRIAEMCDIIEIGGEDKRLQKHGSDTNNSMSS